MIAWLVIQAVAYHVKVDVNALGPRSSQTIASGDGDVLLERCQMVLD